ncbi:hypothetical protein HispidOSU_015208, partial [Sigmodon hispidus]
CPTSPWFPIHPLTQPRGSSCRLIEPRSALSYTCTILRSSGPYIKPRTSPSQLVSLT